MVKRGQMYYIFKGTAESIDNEIHSGRPGIIVSNDHCNASSGVVEVVYLTTQQKIPMSTHTRIESSPRESIALCEQIHSVAVSRIGEYIGDLTHDEMKAVNKALLASLQLDEPVDVVEPYKAEIAQLKLDYATLESERNAYEKILNNLVKGKI